MRRLFFALLVLASGWARAQDITGYEYWFNEDDAAGQRVFVPAGNAPSISLTGLSVAVNALPLGHHAIHFRLQDSNGQWSGVLTKPFTRMVGGPYEITGGEYWFDQSATRTHFPLGPGQHVTVTTDFPTTGLSNGSHAIHYRLRDNHGFWSSVLSKPFEVLPGGPYQLVLLRYWSDTTSQVPSDLTEVPITPPVQYLNIIDDVLFCNWSTSGQTNVYFQLKDNHAFWSAVLQRSYNVASSTAPPAQPGPIDGAWAPAYGTTQTYTIDAVDNAGGYAWTLPDGWTGSSNGTSITVQVGTENNGWQLCVSAYNGCGESDTTCLGLSTGLQQLAFDGGLQLFPNPTTGQFTLALEGNSGPVDISVFNMTGQRVASPQQFDAGTPITMDASGLANGTYIVQWKAGERTGRTLLTVQH